MPNILIIGASRGLGLGLAEEYLKQGWEVVATVRGAAEGGLHDLAARAEGRLEIESVDINMPAEVSALRQRLDGRTFDLLFVNAGVGGDPAQTVAAISTDEFVHMMVTNALSPLRVVEAFEGLVPGSGAIALMTSVLGSVAENESGGFEVYRASKAALNMLMRSFAARHATDSRSLLLMHPGWVRTDLGGLHADLSVEESVAGLFAAIAAQSGKPGLQYLDYRGQTIRW